MSARPRPPTVRSVAVPAEHGGWGLTLEPGILGVLLAPSVAGLLVGGAAVLAFVARTPLRLVLVGRRRSRDRTRTVAGEARSRLAARVALLELAGLGFVVLLAAWLAVDRLWWLPGAAALPFLLLALWFDAQARSRHVIPEIVGSIALASVAAMGALAGGAPWPLALGAWLILGARILTSIPHVRAQVRRIHGRPVAASAGLATDLGALAVAGAAVLIEGSLAAGALAIVVLVALQRITLVQPPRPAKTLGARQMLLGFGVVVATAAGGSLI